MNCKWKLRSKKTNKLWKEINKIKKRIKKLENQAEGVSTYIDITESET